MFLTGAVTLSLEVLASRIMTPYFGVSLYIWSGILSTTLLFLAVGYHFGGRLSQRHGEQTLETRFLAAPLLSTASIVVAAAIYPITFKILAEGNLIVGSFLGATLLLALPLVALSAMNPLLICLQRREDRTGDAGAGRVFFISTLGSVLGVIVTAFVFIPNMTNHRAVLLLGLIMCGAAMILVLLSNSLPRIDKRRLLIGGLAMTVFVGLFFMGRNLYLELIDSSSSADLEFKIRAEYTSVFGNIKVADVQSRKAPDTTERYLVQDGLIQNQTTLNYQSATMYTYVLESFAHIYAPKARDALVLGLGAGIVPRHLSQHGLEVSVMEINPTALRAATENFGFDRNRVNIYLEDARTFVRRCNNKFDVIIVDLFWGDNVSDYLMTKGFFLDLRNCLKDKGPVIMNTGFDEFNKEPNFRLMATVAYAFPNIFLSGIQGGNIFIVGTAGERPEKYQMESTDVHARVASMVNISVTEVRKINPFLLGDSEPYSDDHNVFSVLFSDASLRLRKRFAKSMSPRMLVN
ncbi:MAG: fused MFS/spermidine synthase [Alphaproteobacteria bacterium]|nr:fused MFS/spermidine synthase [Alphaproteobacteria bacterium]